MARHGKMPSINKEYNAGEVSLQRCLSKQRRLALDLEACMEDELASCTRPRSDQIQRNGRLGREKNRVEEQKLRTMVCSEALNQLLELQPAVYGLITDIRSEYEKFISVLSQGQFQFSFLHDEIKRSHTDPLSLILLQKRKDQLKNRIAILAENNERLASQILAMDQTLSLGNKSNNKQTENEIGNKQPMLEGKGDDIRNHLVLQKIPVSAATDLGKLIKYSASLQTKIQKLKNNLRSQYASNSRLQQLKGQLSKKENTQHHLQLYNARLKERFENLRRATESLQGFENKQEKPVTLSKMVNKALEDHRKPSPDQLAFQSLEATGILEDDDPAKKREAETLMEYMDTFNEMLSAKKYEQAAKHAANSPKGILRSFDTMKTFKQIDTTENINDGKSTAMMFCEALMATAESTEKMSAGLSCEIIKCALKNQRLDLVSYWLSKNCFTYSLPLGNLLMEYCKCKIPCKCGSLDLAKEVFSSLGAHRQASLCLLSTGKIYQMIQYGKNHQFSANDYVYLCKRFPSTKLLLLLLSAHADNNAAGLISFPMAINILLKTNNTKVLSEVLQEIYTNGLVTTHGKAKSFTDLLLQETIADDMSKSKWNKVIEFCSKNSLDEIALELLSVLTVREAIDTAAYKYLMDYIS